MSLNDLSTAQALVEKTVFALLDAAWDAWGAHDDDNRRVEIFTVLTEHLPTLRNLPVEIDAAFRWARQRDDEEAQRLRDLKG